MEVYTGLYKYINTEDIRTMRREITTIQKIDMDEAEHYFDELTAISAEF